MVPLLSVGRLFSSLSHGCISRSYIDGSVLPWSRQPWSCFLLRGRGHTLTQVLDVGTWCFLDCASCFWALHLAVFCGACTAFTGWCGQFFLDLAIFYLCVSRSFTAVCFDNPGPHALMFLGCVIQRFWLRVSGTFLGKVWVMCQQFAGLGMDYQVLMDVSLGRQYLPISNYREMRSSFLCLAY